MKDDRRLILRREALAELTGEELSRAVGAAPTLNLECSPEDWVDYTEELLWEYSLHATCTWSGCG
jgi:hypothetical protein